MINTYKTPCEHVNQMLLKIEKKKISCKVRRYFNLQLYWDQACLLSLNYN